MTGFKLTRLQFFGLFFIVVGLILVTQVPARIASDAMSGINLGDNVARLFNQPRVTVNVPTVGYSVVVGIVYVLVGASSFLNWAGLVRYRNPLLIVCGVLLIPTILLITAANNSFNLAIMLRASLRLSTPIIMGAMAGIWCERSGVVNIAIEGMMLIGAGIGFVMFTLSLGTNLDIRQAQWLGVLSAVLAGGLMAVLHAWLSITYKTDQIVSGTVINILAVGLTSFLRREVLISSEAGRETLAAVNLPLLKDIPILGEAIFQGQPIFYMMLLIVVFTHIMLYYTQWGLRTRAVGENPHAADTLGIHVQRNRWINVLIGGMIAGLAGAWFSLETTGSFDDGMTNGKGFIALAAMIFGKWTPFGAAGGGLMFGFAEALGDRFQILGVAIPPQFIQMTPYIVTIVVLAGLVGRAVAPKAVGTPFVKE